jgi:site-specific recombinase XerD
VPVIEKFLKQFNSKRTIKCYEKDITDFLSSHSIDKVKPSDLIKYLSDVKDRTSPTTANRVLSSLKSYYRFLVVEEVVERSPAESLKGFRTSVKAPTIALSDEQVKTILNSVSGVDKLIISAMAYLGLRRDELRNVLISDIATVPGTTQKFLNVRGKGDKLRQIVITDNLYSLIEEFGGVKYLIENTPNKQVGENHIYRVVKKCGKIIETGELTPHSFRATVISQMFEKGVNIRDISQFAGHASITTTQGYDKKRDGLLNSAALGVHY